MVSALNDESWFLFRPQPTSQGAQQEMLQAVDTCISKEAAQACEGTQPIILDELKTSLGFTQQRKAAWQ